MKPLVFAIALAAALTFAPAARAGCNDPDLETVRDDILASCNCNGGNHGQYVSCVAHKVRDAVRDELLDVNCKGKVTKCAARSTCGKKEEFRTCAFCDPGTCTEGFCDDGTTACVDSTTCPPVLRRCATKSSEEHCLASGGIPGTGSCCQATCPVPE